MKNSGTARKRPISPEEFFNNLTSKPNMYLMNSYTSDAYDIYRERYEKEYIVYLIRHQTRYELRSVKNEILRLLGIPQKLK